ncbi:UNVERIFIED_CONTAM: hypothetical protein NCL1_23203 [Trichonephila clavipes]
MSLILRLRRRILAVTLHCRNPIESSKGRLYCCWLNNLHLCQRTTLYLNTLSTLHILFASQS